jgi:hypothetical protein
MENCAIYSHHLAFDQVAAIVKEQLPKAKIEITPQGEYQILTAQIKGGLLAKNKGLRINYRQRLNPSYTLEKVECALTENLAGMANFIKGLPAENSEIQSKLIYKVLSLNCEMGLAAEPSFVKELQEVVKRIAAETDAIVFASPNSFFTKSEAQHFLDKNLDLILDVQGRSEVKDLAIHVESKYYDPPKYSYTDEQLARKEKSEKFLEQLKVPINTNLPGTPEASSITLRSREDVLDRIYALAAIALKGEGLQKDHLDQFIKTNKITSFSLGEEEIMGVEELDDHQRTYASWRYESLNMLMWTVGLLEGIPLPNEVCNVQEIIGYLHHTSREEVSQKAKFIEKEQIIDELDRTYRMNWACVNARVKGEEAPEALHPSIVYERHYALNWLIQYLDQDWDNVQTNT